MELWTQYNARHSYEENCQENSIRTIFCALSQRAVIYVIFFRRKLFEINLVGQCAEKIRYHSKIIHLLNSKEVFVINYNCRWWIFIGNKWKARKIRIWITPKNGIGAFSLQYILYAAVYNEDNNWHFGWAYRHDVPEQYWSIHYSIQEVDSLRGCIVYIYPSETESWISCYYL